MAYPLSAMKSSIMEGYAAVDGQIAREEAADSLPLSEDKIKAIFKRLKRVKVDKATVGEKRMMGFLSPSNALLSASLREGESLSKLMSISVKGLLKTEITIEEEEAGIFLPKLEERQLHRDQQVEGFDNHYLCQRYKLKKRGRGKEKSVIYIVNLYDLLMDLNLYGGKNQPNPQGLNRQLELGYRDWAAAKAKGWTTTMLQAVDHALTNVIAALYRRNAKKPKNSLCYKISLVAIAGSKA